MSAPHSPTEDLEGSDVPATEPPRRHDQLGSGGSAGVHRATAAALGELAEHRAQAVADLDRALAARLGDLDRAIEARRTVIDGRITQAQGTLADAVADFRRAGSDERRLLHEAAAARLADVERAVHQHLSDLEGIASERLEALRQLVGRVHELEQAAAARIEALEERAGGPAPVEPAP
ncbi:MAG: hypothetical protein ACT4PI_02660 [Actinomycetota bacterium]